MAKTVCNAAKTGLVKRRGRASIEWHDKDGKPNYYCYGYIDENEDLILVCKECRDNVIFAQEDLERRTNNEKARNRFFGKRCKCYNKMPQLSADSH